MDKLVFGGSDPAAAHKLDISAAEKKMLHLKYLCRVANNIQQLHDVFYDVTQKCFAPLFGTHDFLAESQEQSDPQQLGMLSSSSIEQLRRQWGKAWDYDYEWEVVRGGRKSIVEINAKVTRALILREAGRLILEANAQAMGLLLSIGEPAWKTQGLLGMLIHECIDPQLNALSDWLEKRELNDVVKECLIRLVQIYTAQLLDHKRWDDVFEDQGRVDTAQCVLADSESLATRFGGLMGADSKIWQRLDRDVLGPLREVGTLMATGADGWMQEAAATVDVYDAGRTARARPYWVPEESREACMICRSDFGLLRRPHHCRYCGWLVCDSCRRPLKIDRWLTTAEPHTIKIAKSLTRKEKEVCTSCFEHAPDEMEDTTGWRGALAELQTK